jgi:enamine deaminase RidA (YjgF/YER057c/UK114 family)
MTRTPVTLIDPPGPASATMASATVHDGVIYLSGVIAAAPGGALIGAGDPAAQAAACLDRIEQVLAAAGAGLGDILRATCFGTTHEAVRAYIAERNRRLPARTAATSVLVSELLVPGALLEVEIIARQP